MTRKKYALKFIKEMTKHDIELLKEKTEGFVTSQELKTEEEAIKRRLEFYLKREKKKLEEENKRKIIDMFDLRNIEKYIEGTKILFVAAFPENLVIIPKNNELFK